MGTRVACEISVATAAVGVELAVRLLQATDSDKIKKANPSQTRWIFILPTNNGAKAAPKNKLFLNAYQV
jgi:hypothetical protein